MKTDSWKVRSNNIAVSIYYDRSQGTYKIAYYEEGKRKFVGAGDNKRRAFAQAKELAERIGQSTVVSAVAAPITTASAAATQSTPAACLEAPRSVYYPEVPMMVEEVTAKFSARQENRMGMQKEGGGHCGLHPSAKPFYLPTIKLSVW
jgi:hypothetical protein